MKNIFLLVVAITCSLPFAYAQEDAKAKDILDKLSAKTKAYKTIKAEFTFIMQNASEDVNESQSGKIDIKGNSYRLSISGQDVICNGKSVWTVLKDAEEVQINEIDEEEDDAISPNKIFTLYEEGFKYKYVKEENGLHVINLYPKAAADRSYHRIVLYINSAKNEINKVVVFGKDGTNTTYKIKTFTPNASISDSHFTFDKTKYPTFEIIDLR